MKFFAIGAGWRKGTPDVVRDGCYLLPAVAPIWASFNYLAGRRPRDMNGDLQPLSYRDIRDEAERCICDLPPRDVETLIASLDDALLSWVAERGRRNSRSENR